MGEVFATFDAQDSGNISYGWKVGEERYFVKTAGSPDDTKPVLRHPERVGLLRNAVRMSERCSHPSLSKLLSVLEGSGYGPILIYEWVEGELLGVPSANRQDPDSAFQRFRALPVDEIVTVLDTVLDLHVQLEALGYVAVDFYDGCLIYDFQLKRLKVIDLDTYHEGSFKNTMGRMFGSTRFMAPEEFQLGAVIDARTNVFTFGRLIAVMLSDGTLDRSPFRGNDRQYRVVLRACQENPSDRFASVVDFRNAWAGSAT